MFVRCAWQWLWMIRVLLQLEWADGAIWSVQCWVLLSVGDGDADRVSGGLVLSDVGAMVPDRMSSRYAMRRKERTIG